MLLLLGIMVAVFAFTLGVHMGKRVAVKGPSATSGETGRVVTEHDTLPNRQELTEQSKGAQQVTDEGLDQALHDEVARTGIKLEQPRQVELPKDAKSPDGGATTLGWRDPAISHLSAAQRPVPEGKFTLQIGSFNAVEEAKNQVDAMEALGLKPFMRAVDIKGKGKWFRIYLGGFPTKEEAEKAGEKFKSQHVIDSFLIAQTDS